jgi:hypothetical protein
MTTDQFNEIKSTMMDAYGWSWTSAEEDTRAHRLFCEGHDTWFCGPVPRVGDRIHAAEIATTVEVQTAEWFGHWVVTASVRP